MWYCTQAQDYQNRCILRIFEGTFLLDLRRLYKIKLQIIRGLDANVQPGAFSAIFNKWNKFVTCHLVTAHQDSFEEVIFYHYENMPIQMYWKCYHQKWKFSDKKFWYFQISAQNIDCGYSLEPPRRGGSNDYPQYMFLSRNMKNDVYPCKPQLCYIKVGFMRVNII